MAEKGIMSSTLKMTLKTYYPLPVHQPLVPPRLEIPTCSSPLPCTKSESSGDDQTESDSLEAPADRREEERLEILREARTDMTEKIQLERAQVSEGEGPSVNAWR